MVLILDLILADKEIVLNKKEKEGKLKGRKISEFLLFLLYFFFLLNNWGSIFLESITVFIPIFSNFC